MGDRFTVRRMGIRDSENKPLFEITDSHSYKVLKTLVAENELDQTIKDLPIVIEIVSA